MRTTHTQKYHALPSRLGALRGAPLSKTSETQNPKPDAVDTAAEEGATTAEKECFSAPEVLSVALEVGAELLRCGADVHRVEDTMTRICAAYGVARSDVFAIPSLITAEITMTDGTSATRVRRILRTYTHLARLERINSLSRAICQHPQGLCEVRQSLAQIRRYRPLPEWLCYVGGALSTGFFALFFGGSWLDGLAAGLIGLLLTFLERHHSQRINAMAWAAVNSFIAGLLSEACVSIGLGTHVDIVIIGTIMLAIPGLSLGNALRDMLCGDTISGALRLIQALLQALMMALGYMVAMVLCAYLWGGASI